MAMEKLILRSIMYGADKIPDAWFDKIPGGYYNAKKEAVKKAVVKEQIEREAHEERKQGRKSSDGKKRHHDRRHSVGASTRAPPPDEEDDSGYRSEGHRRRNKPGRDDKNDRSRQNRRSYDGGDDEDYYSGDDRQRRRRQSMRRAAPEDVGVHYPPRYNMPMRHDAAPPHHARYFDPHAPHLIYPTHAPAVQPPMPMNGMSPPNHPPPVPAPGLAHGYVPYAHIYGGPPNPPMTSHPHDASPSAFVSPLAPPPAPYPVAPAPYQQNVNAQQAPTAEAAGAGAMYTGQPGFLNTERWEPPYPVRPYDRINGFNVPEKDERRSSRDQDNGRRHSPSTGSTRSRGERNSRRESRYDDDRRRTMSHGAYAGERYVDPRIPLPAQMAMKPNKNDRDTRRDSRDITSDGRSRHSGDRRGSKRDSKQRDGYRSE